MRRVLPVIEGLSAALEKSGEKRAAISIDTTSAEVAEAALDRGAMIVNDTSAGLDDAAMIPLVARRGACIILMHRLAKPAVMQRDPRYGDVVGEVLAHLMERAAEAERAGIERDRIAIDPGIGFGKTARHNLDLLAHLDRFVATGYTVMLGASRKRFLGEVTGITDPGGRDAATAAVTAVAARAGVLLHRVHEVPMNRAAADLGWTIGGGGSSSAV
jgi:dihydropteroate synthase